MKEQLTCELTDDEIKEALKSINARADENHPMTVLTAFSKRLRRERNGGTMRQRLLMFLKDKMR
jgi:hypothetical protein